MKLETYLDAMCYAWYDWNYNAEMQWPVPKRRIRQYKKFRQRIIDMYDYPFTTPKWASKVSDFLGGKGEDR